MVQLACFQDTDLLETYKGLTQIFDNLSEGDGASAPEFINKLFSEVESLQADKVVSSDSSSRNLCSDFSQVLLEKSQAGAALTNSEKLELLKACDELRLRCLAVTLGSKLPRINEDASLTVEERLAKLSSKEFGAIAYGECGVTSAVLQDVFVILLPPVISAQQLASVIDYVHQLFSKRQDIKNIAVDFSAVKSIPILLMANMVAYRQSLVQAGRKLHLGWIREDALSDPFRSRMVKVLNLKHVGGFYFSES